MGKLVIAAAIGLFIFFEPVRVLVRSWFSTGVRPVVPEAKTSGTGNNMAEPQTRGADVERTFFKRDRLAPGHDYHQWLQ